jgi:hypothetical protein
MDAARKLRILTFYRSIGADKDLAAWWQDAFLKAFAEKNVTAFEGTLAMYGKNHYNGLFGPRRPELRPLTEEEWAEAERLWIAETGPGEHLKNADGSAPYRIPNQNRQDLT